MEKQEYIDKLREIETEIIDFYKQEYQSDVKEYLKNYDIKHKIKHIIVDIHLDNIPVWDKSLLINRAVLLLAKYSGDVEDLEIAEHILNDLEEKYIIAQPQMELFYNNTPTKRWK